MIGDKLKSLRLKNGYTVAQLCQKMNLNISSYTKYEREERELSINTLSKFADFYGVSTDYLLGRDETNNIADSIKYLIKQYNVTPIEKRILEAYMSLPSKSRENFINFLKRNVAEKEKNNTNGGE